MMRVTDDMVHGFLVWARNYGEIESFEKVNESGRKWRIVLPEPTTASGSPNPILVTVERIVPAEIVLTNREALTFGYGLAAAGNRPESRREIAAREWGWRQPS